MIEMRLLKKIVGGLWACFLAPLMACAQASPADVQAAAPPSGDAPEVTMWKHSESSPFWISGQENVIVQGHPGFPAKETGPQSLKPIKEIRTSFLSTLYLGFQAGKHTEFLVDVESAAGHGISDALGLAGFTNLDVVRNPALGGTPYLARAMIHQTVPLSEETISEQRGPLALMTTVPARRLEFRVGKLSTVDAFDANTVGSDSHLQFMNWTVDNNGAFDYAADTRGYTYGAMVEFQDRHWGVRFGEMLMPRVANGIDLVWNLRKAHAENAEVEWRHSWISGREGAIRLLSFVNHANMGVYRQAIANFLEGRTPVPDITAHPFRTTVKYGFGVNTEQELTPLLRVFARWGWNEGRHESFAYTEVDSTVQAGGDYRGDRWRRKLDKVGLAFISNGISKDHALYLKLGGKGFLLGDGTLTYGREQILEAYYDLHVWRGVYTAADMQYVANPGYNQDRGPVPIPAVRLHIDF